MYPAHNQCHSSLLNNTVQLSESFSITIWYSGHGFHFLPHLGALHAHHAPCTERSQAGNRTEREMKEDEWSLLLRVIPPDSLLFLDPYVDLDNCVKVAIKLQRK